VCQRRLWGDGSIRGFLGVNSVFGFADGPEFGRGSQNAGFFSKLAWMNIFDHTGSWQVE
jgi:hypothetical protein